jgi:hypothetical protein
MAKNNSPKRRDITEGATPKRPEMVNNQSMSKALSKKMDSRTDGKRKK